MSEGQDQSQETVFMLNSKNDSFMSYSLQMAAKFFIDEDIECYISSDKQAFYSLVRHWDNVEIVLQLGHLEAFLLYWRSDVEGRRSELEILLDRQSLLSTLAIQRFVVGNRMPKLIVYAENDTQAKKYMERTQLHFLLFLDSYNSLNISGSEYSSAVETASSIFRGRCSHILVPQNAQTLQLRSFFNITVESLPTMRMLRVDTNGNYDKFRPQRNSPLNALNIFRFEHQVLEYLGF